MFPDVVLFEVSPEDVGQLHTGHFSVRCRRGILRNFNVGKGEMRVGPNQIRPIGAVRSPPGLAASVKAVHKNNDSCPPARLRMVLLRGDLGKGRGSVEQEEQDDQNKLDLHVHPTVSTHLEPEL
jgi:hypothetical protein